MLLHVLDLIGVAVFAISGALAAGRKRLDLLGVLVLGLVTAVGGGTIRDVLLDRQPIGWLADPAYLIIITCSALGTVAYTKRWRPPAAALLVADALGLALFSVTGAEIAERAGLPGVSCVLLGTMTGCAGGVVRDTLTAEIPLVLRRGDLYASAAIAGTAWYILTKALGAQQQVASLSGMLIIAGVRFAAIWWQLRLPEFHVTTAETEIRRE
ncbi:MAG TPA: trimeric intracellular cation channel family protein [Gemmatimonadaceae bacterium]|nr:trimeric intracellular cation channel family protein [Gemmatimonadaceae bacterium]